MRKFKNNNLILTAFSTRAAAECFSSKKNIKIYSFDFFGDLDLKEVAHYAYSLKENNYIFQTKKLFEVIKTFLNYNSDKNYNLIYGSDWDNQPELLYKLEQFNNLKIRGNSASIVFKLNKKENLKTIFKTAENVGFKTPELFLNKNKLVNFHNNAKKDLIIKPYRSGGGLNLELIKAETNKAKKIDDIFIKKKNDYYVQEFITGENRSCQFAADGKNTKILSFTKELKASEVNSKLTNNFKYAGNILIKEEKREIKIIKEFIKKITREYSLQGINGIDYIKNNNGIFFIELNPRFTAAVELLKPLYKKELFNIYFKKKLFKNYLKTYLQKDFGFCAKVIYYTNQDFQLTKNLDKIFLNIKRKKSKQFKESKIEIKDLPKKGESFSKKDPVFTLIIKTINENQYLELKNLIFYEFELYLKNKNQYYR
jgi:predicted ATP-grasp superfamily ATP-dependent carboligase